MELLKLEYLCHARDPQKLHWPKISPLLVCTSPWLSMDGKTSLHSWPFESKIASSINFLWWTFCISEQHAPGPPILKTNNSLHTFLPLLSHICPITTLFPKSCFQWFYFFTPPNFSWTHSNSMTDNTLRAICTPSCQMQESLCCSHLTHPLSSAELTTHSCLEYSLFLVSCEDIFILLVSCQCHRPLLKLFC